MLPTHAVFRERLREVILDKERQGHVVDGLDSRLDATPDDYQKLADFGAELAGLPLRDDWPYVEPDDLDGIRREQTWDGRALDTRDDVHGLARRAEAGFLARVCGCVLGKPIEIRATHDVLRPALESVGDWPLTDYVSRRLLDEGALPRLHRSWPESVREQIRYVPPDDDLHYTLLGLLTLERHGLAFTKEDLYEQWINHLPIRWTFGPERTTLVRFGLAQLLPQSDPDLEGLAGYVNPGEERCGAMIRVDAYGYACAGRPELAAELAWRDATLTHRRTGVYGAMFNAAAIATAFVVDDPLELFAHALAFVPRRSRFHHIVSDSLEEIRRASDWEDGYRRIHGKYAEYTHCRVLQEVGTLVNTMRFAESSGHGIGLQVGQGNDTDSFGATAGSLLGIRFGLDGLEQRWLTPFHDTIRTQLAGFHDYSLSHLARRMGELPALGRAA